MYVCCVFYINIYLPRLTVYFAKTQKAVRVVASKEENWMLGADNEGGKFYNI